MAATLSLELAGIGGLTIDLSQPGALRMRRFYVGAAFPPERIRRSLAENLLARALTCDRTVTVNAGAGSEPFWRSLGFVAEARNRHTHVWSKLSLSRFSRP